MTEIVPFAFGDHQVRVVVDDAGEPWWVAADVAKILGYRDAATAVRTVRDHHRGTQPVRTPGGVQQMIVVNLAGLNRMVLRSDSELAEPFQDWVTDDVLPRIQTTGTYSAQPAIPQTYAEALRAYAAEVEARELANAKIAELEPAAEFHDRFMESGGLSSMTDLADMFGTSVGKFTGWLVDLGIFRKGEYAQYPGRRMPRKQYQDANLFEVRIEVSDRGINYPVAYATPEGLVFIREALRKNGLAD